MNPNQPGNNDERLNHALRQWAVTAPLPPRFQEQVWQRIARAEAAPVGSWRPRWERLLELVLPRPQFALAYLALLLMLGGVAGSLAAQMKTSHLESDLSMRYVQSIDPFRAAAVRP